MNVILLEPEESTGARVRLSDERARHLRKVLKVATGSVVRVGIVNGPLGVGTVIDVDADDVTLECTFDDTAPPRPRVDLLLALPRPKVLRRLWPHLAASGVGQVILTNAAKVERDYFDSHYVHPSGFRPLLIEGLQQARDTHLPDVSVHKQFRKLVEDDLDMLVPDATRLVAHPDGGSRIADVSGQARVLLAVGPEGGWNDFELDLLESRGFRRVSLGPRVLTTTAACIALLALTHDAIR